MRRAISRARVCKSAIVSSRFRLSAPRWGSHRRGASSAEGRVRQHIEALGRDLVLATDADPVGSGAQALKGGADARDLVLSFLAKLFENLVALAFDREFLPVLRFGFVELGFDPVQAAVQ